MVFSFQNFIQISVQFSGSLIATHIHENTINLTLQCHTQLVARPSEIIIFFSISDSTMRKNLVSVLQFLGHIRKSTKILYFLQKKYYLSRKFLKNLLFPKNLYNKVPSPLGRNFLRLDYALCETRTGRARVPFMGSPSPGSRAASPGLERRPLCPLPRATPTE